MRATTYSNQMSCCRRRCHGLCLCVRHHWGPSLAWTVFVLWWCGSSCDNWPCCAHRQILLHSNAFWAFGPFVWDSALKACRFWAVVGSGSLQGNSLGKALKALLHLLVFDLFCGGLASMEHLLLELDLLQPFVKLNLLVQQIFSFLCGLVTSCNMAFLPIDLRELHLPIFVASGPCAPPGLECG